MVTLLSTYYKLPYAVHVNQTCNSLKMARTYGENLYDLYNTRKYIHQLVGEICVY